MSEIHSTDFKSFDLDCTHYIANNFDSVVVKYLKPEKLNRTRRDPQSSIDDDNRMDSQMQMIHLIFVMNF